jgi:cysteine desulfurase family protein (TIGR01976 family)
MASACRLSAGVETDGLNRSRFPGLADGWVRADAPSGTQPVDSSIGAMREYMESGDSANVFGQYRASQATTELVETARRRVGDLFGAPWDGVVFGPSMTALAFRLTHALENRLGPGDRIVSTRLEHDANVRPWAIAAARAGAEFALLDLNPETLELDARSVIETIDERTRWVAIGAASNALGTLNDLAPVVQRAHAVGARVFVDAVAAAPHRPLNIAEQGIDVLTCSAYKWFGPHVGILCSTPALLAELAPDRLATSPADPPASWELGTLPLESLAGVIAAVDYMHEVGFDRIAAHEQALTDALASGLAAIDGVQIFGKPARRIPTVFFNVHGVRPRDVTIALADRCIAATGGDVYAHELCSALGLGLEGAARLGFVHYSGLDEVERAVSAVAEIAARASV